MDVDPSVEGDNSDQSHDTAGPAVPPMHAEGGMSDSGKDAKADEGDTPVYETRHMADPAKVRHFAAFQSTAFPASSNMICLSVQQGWKECPIHDYAHMYGRCLVRQFQVS